MKLTVKNLSLKPSFSSTNSTNKMIPDSLAKSKEFEVPLIGTDDEKFQVPVDFPCEHKRSELKELMAEFRYG